MSASRRKKKRHYTTEELYNPQIDVSRDAYVYGRQSQKEQMVKNIQSHISQTIMLVSYTKEVLGYTDDETTGNVTLFVENQVIDANGNVSIKNASGTWSIDRRPGLKTICDQIETGSVGVVIAEFVDRLFRDEDRIDSNVFIKICKENDCFVHISSKRMTYNFANVQHAELFRLEVQMAAAYIDNHVRGTMLSRRSQAARLGGLWAGIGAIPVGYIVDKSEGSPTYGKFIVYAPHALIVVELFIRFIELGSDLDALCEELQDKPYIFPDFEEWVDNAIVARCNLRPGRYGGYMISRRGLKHMLTNDVYIGTFRREGAVLEHNHAAIINEGVFWSVYDRLKCKRPDGTPTGKLQLVRYTQKKNEHDRPPLLKPLTNADGSVYFSNNKTSAIRGTIAYYHVSVHRGLKRRSVLSIQADVLEEVVIARMFWHLRQVNLGDIRQLRARKLEEKRKRVVELDRTLQVIEEEIEALEDNMTKITMEAVVKQLETKMARLLTQKDNLEDERSSIVASYKDIPDTTLEEELQDLEELWPAKPFQLKKALVELLARRVVVDYVTPRFWKVQVVWSYSEWGTEERLIDRHMAGSKPWSEHEKEVLKAMYEWGEQIDMMQALPDRTWRGICDAATALGLRRQEPKKETIQDHTITIDDLALLKEKGLTLGDTAICNWNICS